MMMKTIFILWAICPYFMEMVYDLKNCYLLIYLIYLYHLNDVLTKYSPSLKEIFIFIIRVLNVMVNY